MPSPWRSKLTWGSASVPVALAVPVTVPRSPRLPAARSTRASGKALRSTARSRLPAPSGTVPFALAARPFCEVTAASRLSRFSAVCPVARRPTGGSPALRVIADAMPSAFTSNSTLGASRGPVTCALPLTVPARPRSGRIALASASGRLSIASSRSKLSSSRPCAVSRPCPKSRASGVRSIAPPRIVTVAGAVSVAVTSFCRSRSVSRVAAKPSSSRARSPERSASVPTASRASAAKCIFIGSTWFAVACTAFTSMPPTSRSLPFSVPSISGSPRASAILASRSSSPTRVPPTTRSFAFARTATPWPTSALSSVRSALTEPVASTSASEASGAISGAASVI